MIVFFLGSSVVVPVLGVLMTHLVRYGWSVRFAAAMWALAVAGVLAFAVLSFFVRSDCLEYASAGSGSVRTRIRIRLWTMAAGALLTATAFEAGIEVAAARNAPGSSTAAVALITVPLFIVLAGVCSYVTGFAIAGLIVRNAAASAPECH